MVWEGLKMVTKKRIFIACGLLLAIIAIVVIFYKTSGQKDQAGQKMVKPSGEKVITYSSKGGNLKILNNSTGKFEYLSDLKIEEDAEVDNVALSPDTKKYLYTTVQVFDGNKILGEEDDEEARTIYLSDAQEPIIFKAYSPAWLSDNKIIYQDRNSFELVVYSVVEKKEIQRKDYGLDYSVEIQPLDEQQIITVPSSYDVVETTSKIINLGSDSVKDYIDGLGLQIKTIVGSDLLAYQTSDENGNTNIVIFNWKTGKKIGEKSNISLQLLTWDSQGNIKYIDNKTNNLVDLNSD